MFKLSLDTTVRKTYGTHSIGIKFAISIEKNSFELKWTLHAGSPWGYTGPYGSEAASFQPGL